jgi:hypothetical protein
MLMEIRHNRTTVVSGARASILAQKPYRDLRLKNDFF